MPSHIKPTGGGPPEPSPTRPQQRDYAADETCAVESLLMLSRSICPSSPPSSNLSTATSSTPMAATPPVDVKKTQDRSPPRSSNLPYTCDMCPESFKSYQALGGHKTRHRPKSTTATADLTVSGSKNNERVHECSICYKRFRSGQALGGHKRKHYNGIIGGASKSVGPASSDESPSRDSGGVMDIEDDRDFDLNLPYIWLY